MALINCKECGKEISSEAATCPHCGVKNTPQINLKAKAKTSEIIVGIIVVLIGIGWLLADKKPSTNAPAATTTAPEQPPVAKRETYQTTVRHLSSEYEKNEVETDERISSKKVILLGVIQAINKNMIDEIVVLFQTNNEFMPAAMTMNDAAKERVKTLKKGDKVAVTCEKFSRIMGSPTGTNCIFINPVEPLPTYR